MEAQRFPRDFNGIIAGAPAFNQAAPNAMEEPYESTRDENADGSPILTAAASAVLHTDIISQCAGPRLKDGTIQDPRDCQPGWAKIQCPAGAASTAGCLTAAQVAAATRLYTGAVAQEVRYDGTGDPDQAASYVPVAPSAPRHDNYRWAGYPFRSGYEQWCQLSGDAKALVCKREGEQGA